MFSYLISLFSVHKYFKTSYSDVPFSKKNSYGLCVLFFIIQQLRSAFISDLIHRVNLHVIMQLEI